MEKRAQIPALTSARFLAAMWVVVFHYYRYDMPLNADAFFCQGSLAVSFFFVLSGYVMTLTYHDRQVSYSDFLVRRVARIMPLHLIIVAAYATKAIIFGKPPLPGYWTHIALNVGLLQGYVPGTIGTINMPSWSLCCEMLFYLLFPFLLIWMCGKQRSFWHFAAGLFIVTQVVYNYFFFKRLYFEFSSYNPLMHLNQFLVGMAAGWLMIHRLPRFSIHPLIPFVLIVIIVCKVAPDIGLHDGLLAPLFAVLIMSLTTSQPGWMKSRPAVYLGEISYGIYLLQYPVFSSFPVLPFYTKLTILFAAAAVSYHFLERPSRSLIISLSRRRQPHAHDAP